MQYADIYKMFDPIFQWLKENYPHNTYFVVDANSATMCHKRSIFAMNGYNLENGKIERKTGGEECKK